MKKLEPGHISYIAGAIALVVLLPLSIWFTISNTAATMPMLGRVVLGGFFGIVGAAVVAWLVNTVVFAIVERREVQAEAEAESAAPTKPEKTHKPAAPHAKHPPKKKKKRKRR